MPADSDVAVWVQSFALVLARVSSTLVFVPLPGASSLPRTATITFAVALTALLRPFWPVVQEQFSAGAMAMCLIAEAGFGVTVGLTIAACAEIAVMAAQMIGLQAGYSYASTVDPVTHSDSTVLQSIARLFVGMVTFAVGGHHEVIRIFTATLQQWPPGQFTMTDRTWQSVAPVLATMFSSGLRLALPVVGVLLLTDITLAVLGRLNTQLQLLGTAFSLKMLVGIGLLAAVLPATATTVSDSLTRCMRVLSQVLA